MFHSTMTSYTSPVEVLPCRHDRTLSSDLPLRNFSVVEKTSAASRDSTGTRTAPPNPSKLQIPQSSGPYRPVDHKSPLHYAYAGNDLPLTPFDLSPTTPDTALILFANEDSQAFFLKSTTVSPTERGRETPFPHDVLNSSREIQSHRPLPECHAPHRPVTSHHTRSQTNASSNTMDPSLRFHRATNYSNSIGSAPTQPAPTPELARAKASVNVPAYGVKPSTGHYVVDREQQSHCTSSDVKHARGMSDVARPELRAEFVGASAITSPIEQPIKILPTPKPPALIKLGNKLKTEMKGVFSWRQDKSDSPTYVMSGKVVSKRVDVKHWTDLDY